ncbi:MAG: 2-succinyl-5-enolpyruvyl-6-hydroxy-3-cyclohexene-1-carboxylic-acid synthase [Anaerolineae bacterium]|nr:2-succinyl-5-enolpyruvyl-6-hydroxy-3-cyclohexene-1-carboxylic-acid synthase [Anaerolineae bacterium]
MANRNTLYAEIFVDELVRAGLKHVVLAPGSRNTALVLAFAQHDAIKKHSHLDERSAAFYALGIALATDEPVAIVCTSGTAAANFFPAIVEAHQSCVPLLVLTADRPPELRHSGANQTIDQIKLYGDYALWFVDAALPEGDPPAVAIRNLRTLANRAFAKANGLRKGVVHVNLPFRKPLEPTPVEGDQLDVAANPYPTYRPFTSITQGVLEPSRDQIQSLLTAITESPKGLIVCGPNTTKSDAQPYYRLSQVTGYPLLAEPTSGLRFGEQAPQTTISSYNNFPLKGELLAADLIIQFGDVPTSNALLTYLSDVRPKHRILITGNGEWRDDKHTLSAMIGADPVQTINRLTESLQELKAAQSFIPNAAWQTRIQDMEKTSWAVLDKAMHESEYFDGNVIYDVVDLIPNYSSLFTGNSLPIRNLDQFGKPSSKQINAYANRGASGIDGNISTALGIGAANPDRPLIAIVGDVTFYHDMNGLLAVQRCGVPVTIVLLNNNGGGIFHRLPIKDYDPTFTDYFLTPHNLDFSHAARLYGLEYHCITSREDFRHTFSERVCSGQSTIIEVRTDARQDFARRQAIMQQIQAQLHDQGLS